MTTEEQEITLIVQRDHLTTSEHGHGREHGSEQSANRDTEQSRESVQDEFRWKNPKLC